MGRQSKGPRQQVSVRAHPDLKRAIDDTATALGYEGSSDYVCAVMARELRRPDLAPAPVRANNPDQGRFPLTG